MSMDQDKNFHAPPPPTFFPPAPSLPATNPQSRLAQSGKRTWTNTVLSRSRGAGKGNTHLSVVIIARNEVDHVGIQAAELGTVSLN